MKKVIFIDRDGTLIIEPPVTEQVNSLEEMTFLPYVISALKSCQDQGFELVIITNQDGLGTKDNPRDTYEKINAKMLEVFTGEGITFTEFFECPHYPKDNCDCRKPKTGMVDAYLKNNKIDLTNSYMIGDRESDILFAENIGVQGLLLSKKLGWREITDQIINKPRTAQINRKTKETAIDIDLNLDGSGVYDIKTDLKFFDHMLDQLSKHSGFDLTLACKGDLEIDEHHTVEDTALALGEAFKTALGDKRGIERFAWERILVMDEAKVEVSIDLSGRPFVTFNADFEREYVGDLPTEMIEHFYQSFCLVAGINAHITITGKNTHHMIEASFKAFAKVLRDAVKRTGTGVSSTKGMLT
ncbi:MAG: bifunctional histidinol-phosphatase/imidazoleglycerol-phosphate dehydratase HisB [Alphaproteobacteria bacterium]